MNVTESIYSSPFVSVFSDASYKDLDDGRSQIGVGLGYLLVGLDNRVHIARAVNLGDEFPDIESPTDAEIYSIAFAMLAAQYMRFSDFEGQNGTKGAHIREVCNDNRDAVSLVKAYLLSKGSLSFIFSEGEYVYLPLGVIPLLDEILENFTKSQHPLPDFENRRKKHDKRIALADRFSKVARKFMEEGSYDVPKSRRESKRLVVAKESSFDVHRLPLIPERLMEARNKPGGKTPSKRIKFLDTAVGEAGLTTPAQVYR